VTDAGHQDAAAEHIARGRRVLQLEREALAEAERRLGDDFARAVSLVAAAPGRVIVSGVGKSGLIGRKIAATLTSTGTPAAFLHPTDSVHGDLGIVDDGDVAILLSKSGETEELAPLLNELKRRGVRIVAITGNARSTLGRLADVVLDGWVREEACPHDLAPTTSTTVALALGDALAVALLQAKGFRREDFARLHPGGSLGKRLLLRVRDVMETDALPVRPATATVRDSIVLLAERRGIVLVTAADGTLEGVFTAGDLTRVLEQGDAALARPLGEVMTRGGRRADGDELASAVVGRMERYGIVAMPVADAEGRAVGVVHLHDLMRAGVS
jgi:arabinose-5-phosphate isomerase